MYPWSTKSKILIYVVCMVSCALLFYYTLSSAKKREEKEIKKNIEIAAIALDLYREKLVEDGYFDCNGVKYKVSRMDANSLK